MQFEKNVVEQFLWESYSIDSRKYLYKIINESDEDTCMNIAKNRILQDLFLLRRGKDPGFAFHVYSRINNNDRAFRNTVLYIQKLLLDGPYYNENQILSPDSSNQGLDKKKLAIDSDLKHNFHFSISFEDRGDGLFNFKTNNFADNYEHSKKESTKESLEYFNQRYEIALEDKDDLTAGAIHDLISEYKTHHYSLDYFSKKQHFYWNAATEKEKNFDLIRYVNENISNYGLYDANPANSELELTLHILSLGLEEKLIKILNNYDVGVIANSSEDKFSLQYFKFLTDAFSITSTIWFNSLSLNEKEKLLNGVYSFDQEKFTAYLSTLYKNKIDCSELKYLALSMYLNGFLDVAESIYVYLSDNAKDNLDNAGYLSQLGDIYREEIEYEKAYGMYRQLFDLSSKFPLKNRRNNLKNSGLYENPQYVSTISLLRMAEMECLLGEANAEIHLQEVKDRIDKTNKLEKISLMWNLACTYRRIGQFEHEYECLDDLASLGEGKRNDLVDKADNRIIQINEYFSRTLEKLDEKKLDEDDKNKKWHKLVRIAESLRNSFQFERESTYWDAALKIKDDDGIKLDLAISKYNKGDLAGSRIHFENLVSSSNTDIVIKSHIYLAFINFQQKANQKGFDNISNAFMPHIAAMSTFNLFDEDVELKQDFNQETFNIITGSIKAIAIEPLIPVIELCVTNLLPLKKHKILNQIIDNILESSYRMCPPDVYHTLMYATIQILFSKGLTNEAIRLSEISIEQFSTNEMHKIAAMDTTANIYFELDQYDQSIKYLKDALEIDSQLPNLWKNLGLNYEQLLDFEKAEECIDKALKINPDYPNLDILKEKYNRLKKDTINFIKIKDEHVKRFFMSAERLVLDLSKSIKDDEFDFTMALVSYGKGLESLLHKEVSTSLRKKIHNKYGTPISDEYFENLPYSLKKILGKKEQTITLGSWQYVINDCKTNTWNPIIRESRDYFTGKLNKNKNVVFDSCNEVSKYRNGSAHYTSKTMDEIMDDRKIIVEKINNVINVFYS